LTASRSEEATKVDYVNTSPLPGRGDGAVAAWLRRRARINSSLFPLTARTWAAR
jgi:hypothetical protein